MGLYVLACTCSNSDSLARKVMRMAGLENYDLITVHRGKNNAERVLSQLAEFGYDVEQVKHYVMNTSRYVIFVGTSSPENPVRWQDCSSGAAESMTRAEAIAASFSRTIALKK